MQMEKAERPRPLDDPTRPYIKFDIVAHLDALSSHEGTKRVSSHCLASSSQTFAAGKFTLCYFPSPDLTEVDHTPHAASACRLYPPALQQPCQGLAHQRSA